MPYKDKNKAREYQQNWYKNNRESEIVRAMENNKEKRKVIRKFLQDYKTENPCTDCNQCFPYYVMDFDHLRDKFMGVSKMTYYSLDTVKKEIEKCDLVCANCHRIRTFTRIA